MIPSHIGRSTLHGVSSDRPPIYEQRRKFLLAAWSNELTNVWRRSSTHTYALFCPFSVSGAQRRLGKHALGALLGAGSGIEGLP